MRKKVIILGADPANIDLAEDRKPSSVGKRQPTPRPGVRTASPFERYRGIGNPGIGSGRAAVVGWVRNLRGPAR
jgi:hypothetical protein